MAAPCSLQAVKRILRANRRYHNEFNGFLTNHLSHGAVALYKLGASPERLDNYSKKYQARLEPPRVADLDAAPITADNWQEWLGKRHRYHEYVAFFEQELHRVQSVERLIAEYFPTLSPGMAGAALHPAIHLGWALDMSLEAPEESAMMVAEGLAYMVTAYFPMRPDKAAQDTPDNNSSALPPLSAADILLGVHKEFKPLFPQIEAQAKQERYTNMRLGGFQTKMHVLHDDFRPRLHKWAKRLVVEAPADDKGDKGAVDLQNQMTQTVLRAFNVSEDSFFMLHGVTLWYGLCRIMPCLSAEHKLQAMNDFFHAYLAAFVALDMPGAGMVPIEGEVRDVKWSSVLKAAVDEGVEDEHTIKIAYVSFVWANAFHPERSEQLCKELEEELPGPMASRLVATAQENSRGEGQPDAALAEVCLANAARNLKLIPSKRKDYHKRFESLATDG